MKTAVLLSGQPRYVTEHYHGIKSNLIDVNNADVYIHVWEDDQDKPFRAGRGWQKERLTPNFRFIIPELYKPKKIKIESQKKDFPITDVDFSYTLANNMGGGSEIEDVKKHYIFATQSMWYSIKSVFDLIKEDYDAVILTRFDLGISSPIVIKNYNLESVWGQDISRPDLLLNWMNFGSFSKMKFVFGEMYDRISQLYSETNIWCNEYWCNFICENNSIGVRRSGWGLTIPSRVL